jgi:hypothetical protein
LGANIGLTDKYKSTPLHTAAGFYRVDTVRLLMERGANIHAENSSGQTPLAYALIRCRNADIANMAKIAELLLGAGARVTPDMAESVRNIGNDFEFHRESFNKDYLAETDAGLTKLYELFDVEPVAGRRVHDGVSPITVTAAKWQKQHNELWEYLVPSQGAAKTVQGEVIRITGRVADELYRNGGCNWDANYRKMLDALLAHLASGTPLSASELNEANAMIKVIRPNGDGDDETDKLCELAVKWVLQNTLPIKLGKTDYKR